MDLIKFDEAKRALAEYVSVDEVKDFRDKAVAIEAYAKQANDFTLESDAAKARVRAERRCGQLLKETEFNKGGGDLSTGAQAEPVLNINAPKTLDEMNITKKQSSKWQQLADMPDDEFEEKVNVPGAVPSTNHLLRKDEEIKRIDRGSLYIWGRFTDFERDVFDRPLDDFIAEMTEPMKTDMLRIIPKIKSWVTSYER